MSTSTKISSACTRACKSMPSSFGDSFLCENLKHSPLELGAHSWPELAGSAPARQEANHA